MTTQASGRAPPVPAFPILYAAVFLIATGNIAMMSLFPAIARTSGIPDAVMTAVQSVSAGLSIIATPFWASRSDRVGRKPIIMVGMAGFTIASLVTALAIWSAVNHLLPLFFAVAALVASRAIFGLFGLAANPAIQAHIADNTTRENRTRTFASIFSAGAIGSILGPALAPLLILPVVGFAGPQLFFTVAGAAVLTLILFKVPHKGDRRSPQGRVRSSQMSILKLDTVWPFVAYMAVLSGCQAANLQTLGFLVIDRTGLNPMAAQPKAGLALMLGAAVAAFIQLVLLRRIRLRPPQLMVCGLTIVICGNLLMAFASSYALVMTAFIVSSAGYGFGAPAAAAGASLANLGDHQGGVAGFVSAASSSGLTIAPVITMILYQYDPHIAFMTIAAVIFILLLTIVPRCARALARSQKIGVGLD